MGGQLEKGTDLLTAEVSTEPRRGKRRRADERGMTTAEYAVGTVASVTVVGTLIKIFSDENFRNLLWELLKFIFELIMKLIAG